MATETMNISLPDSLKRYVERRVAEDGYGNTSEFIRELIRHDRAERRRVAQDKLEAMLLEAIDELDRGEKLEVTPEYWTELRREARQSLAEELSAKESA